MMDAPVDAIDDEAETLAKFVGQPLSVTRPTICVAFSSPCRE